MKKINTKYNGKTSLSQYSILLEDFLKNDYKFKSYSDVDPNKKHVILRHDIDFLPEDAIKLAMIEKNYNVKSHFFFLVNTEFYNINSNKIKKIIYQLKSQKHYIGLHFDPKYSMQNIEECINEECLALERIIKLPLNIISFHRPMKKLLNFEKKLANRIHTYMPKWWALKNQHSVSKSITRILNKLKENTELQINLNLTNFSLLKKNFLD